MPTQRMITVTLNGNITAGATSLTFSDGSVSSYNTASVIPGQLLAIDLELFLVTGSPVGGVVSVSPGYNGSAQANHTNGALIYVNPRYSDFDILTAINHDLDDLCSPANGLYNLASMEVSYNPVYEAYDLTDINTSQPIVGLIDIIALRYKTPLADRRYHAIPEPNWELVPAMSVDTNFPSGYALNIFGDVGGWPGLPINVIYRQAFVHLANYADNVQSVALLPASANDLPPLGAMISMVGPREVGRNELSSQPDARLATEVPPSAIANSTAPEMRQRAIRIDSERSRLNRTISHLRRRF